MMATTFHHVSVLRDEAIEGLNIRPDGCYVDGTLGGAGHAGEIVRCLGPDGRLIGIDRDPVAIAHGQEVLTGENVTLVHNNFSEIKQILRDLHVEKVDGVLLDLGVSSKQLDDAERGFSYMQDAPLDMRMDTTKTFSAYEVVNHYSEEELRRVITDYGEEKWAARIARFIVERRPLCTTLELVSAIKAAIPKGAREDGPHPAKRTFQAIRIEVNGELRILEQAIKDIADCLAPGGRIAVITFHSLEDRLVKQAMKDLENPCTCPKTFPVCVCGKKPVVRILTRKPIVPSDEEIEANPRARSAKLRVAEKR